MAKNIRCTIEKIVTGGAGFSFCNNHPYFIPYTCPEDVVCAETTKEKKDFSFAQVTEITKPSSCRTTPKCAYYFSVENLKRYGQKYRYCGGCDFQHIEYSKQLGIKENIIKETFLKIGGIKEISLEPIIGMNEPWQYRNKVQLPVGKHKEKLRIGFFKPGSHEIVDIQDCPVQEGFATPVINALRKLLEKYKIPPYNEHRHTGWLRHILIRTARHSKKLLIILVTKTSEFHGKKQFCNDLIGKISAVSGIFQNINPGKTNVIIGAQTIKIWGDDFIEEKLGSVKYAIKPTAFFQINPVQTEKLYGVVKEMVACLGAEVLFDLYCGSGGMGIYLAETVQKIVGIEESKESIESARLNAEINKYTNCIFLHGDVEVVFKKALTDNIHNKHVVIVDPPRAGCAKQLLEIIAHKNLPVVYVSCNPATLARDVKILSAYGYTLTRTVPIDMFPQTSHIETVALLKKQ